MTQLRQRQTQNPTRSSMSFFTSRIVRQKISGPSQSVFLIGTGREKQHSRCLSTLTSSSTNALRISDVIEGSWSYRENLSATAVRLSFASWDLIQPTTSLAVNHPESARWCMPHRSLRQPRRLHRHHHCWSAAQLAECIAVISRLERCLHHDPH
jgi:hypothetical protein